MYGLQPFNLPVISTLRKASDGSQALVDRGKLSRGLKKCSSTASEDLREGLTEEDYSIPQEFLLEIEFEKLEIQVLQHLKVFHPEGNF